MDIQHRQDCERDIRRIEQLFGCGILNRENAGHILQVSAFIDLMICMRDLIYKTEKYVRRIDFTDDVLINEYVTDVTGAITAVRDACCHIDSFKKLFDDNGNRGEFMVAYGKTKLALIGDFDMKGEYEDDTAIFYGRNRVYLRRHVLRAFNESKELLQPLLEGRAA